jgi:hypothetical protein
MEPLADANIPSQHILSMANSEVDQTLRAEVDPTLRASSPTLIALRPNMKFDGRLSDAVIPTNKASSGRHHGRK